MKIINKIALFMFTCITLSTVPAFGFYYGDDAGANFVGNAGTATLFAGAATGNRAAIGAGAGLMATGAIMGTAGRNKRRRDDDYYYEKKSRSSRKRQRRLEDENADLRRRLQEYEN